MVGPPTAISSTCIICIVKLPIRSIKSMLNATIDVDSYSDKTGLGVAAASIGFVCGSFLAAFKFKVGKELESSTVITSAISSKCAALTSVATIVAIIFNQYYSWLDSSLGIIIASYIFYHGVSVMMDARVSSAALLYFDEFLQYLLLLLFLGFI